MHRFALDVGVERGAAVVAELEGELLAVHDDFLDAGLTQQGFDFADDVGVLVLGTEQRPDDAVVNRFAVTRSEADAIFLEALVLEGADDGAQRFGGLAQRGLQEGHRGAQRVGP